MDSPWAFRRRARLSAVILLVGVVFLVWYLYVNTYAPPTCFHAKRNQAEEGTDCGGPCRLLCPFHTEDTEVMWTRLFEISPGSWTAVAYVQNRNYNAYTPDARYRFTLYDSSGRSIGTREGTTFVGGEPTLAVVESRIEGINNEPYRATFEWVGKPSYYREERIRDVVIEQHEIVPSSIGVDVRAVINNKQPVSVEDVEVVLIAYDKDQNATAVSKTYVEYLGPRSTQSINFSWPKGFSVKPSRIEFIPRVPATD